MSEFVADSALKPVASDSRTTKVALLSCGLGYVNRGFEVSTARLFEAIRDSKELNVRLFTGGPFPDSTQVPNLPRDFMLKTVLKLASLFNERRIWEFAYGIEQVTFALGVIGPLIRWQPDVVWTKEAPMAHVLLGFRDFFKLKFRIVFANGGGFRPNTYEVFDYIQHLQATSYEEALQHGVSASKMQTLPNIMPSINPTISREAARASFGFGPNDWVIISVAAWNRYHKRIDYLIEEVASMQDENTRLLLCGHPEPDTGPLKALAKKKLGNKVQWHTLAKTDIPRALKAADVFVMASLRELFGSAGVEAAMAELPVVMHPHGASRILSEHGFEAVDLSEPGNLTKHLQIMKNNPPDSKALKTLSDSLKSNLSEAAVTEKFVSMIKQIAAQ